MIEDINEFEALLPWFVNGTLNAQDKEAMDSYLVVHPELEAKVASLTAMKHIYHEKQGVIMGPGTFGLARLHRSMKNEVGKRPAINSWWKAGIAASLLVVILQSSLLLKMDVTPSSAYQVLSGNAASVDGDTWQIRFNDEVTEQQMRLLLRNTGFIIVAGPSLIGVYHVKAVDGTARRTAEIRESSYVADFAKD